MREGSTLDGGKYRIVRLIAKGAMGEVYEAEHTVMSKRVAIKWIHPGLSARARATERLVQEARAAARIRHPHVVDIYDVGREGDVVYLVMEYLEGEPLSQLLARGGMTMPAFLRLLLPAMRGVAVGHRQGVVHRDLKPDNIYVTNLEERGRELVKVLDFGVSKLDPRGEQELSLTRSGAAVGTPLYMSYEQLCGSRNIDGRTDVYAFGVILYEALTGQLPYRAESYAGLVAKVTLGPPPSARTLNAQIPKPLDRIVRWALAKEASDRIESIDALVRELEPFATESGFRADMETDEIPMLPVPLASVRDDGLDDTSLAPEATVHASRLRRSEHISAIHERRPSRRTRVLSMGALVVLVIAGGIYGTLHRAANAAVPAQVRSAVAPVRAVPASEDKSALRAPESTPRAHDGVNSKTDEPEPEADAPVVSPSPPPSAASTDRRPPKRAALTRSEDARKRPRDVRPVTAVARESAAASTAVVPAVVPAVAPAPEPPTGPHLRVPVPVAAEFY